MKGLFDAYDRRARLYPIVLVLLPLAFGAITWVHSDLVIPSAVGTAVVTLAIGTLLMQISRDQGKRREKELFKSWGGRPSDKALSYAGRVFAESTLARWHSKLRALEPNLCLPASLANEREDPKSARLAYAAATDLLVAKTRDREKYSLLFKENMNYGFRRNLWGMKPAGIVTSLLGLGAAIARVVWVSMHTEPLELVPIATCVVCVMMLVVWSLRVTPAWVRVPADGYAKHLAEACESL